MRSMMNRLLPFRAIFSFVFLLHKVSTESLEGPYVCVNKEKIQTTKLLPYQRAYQYRTYEFCFDAKESFRCPVNKIGYKTSYKNVTKIEIVARETCCPGFVQENLHCIPSGSTSSHIEHSHHPNGFIAVVVVIAFSIIAVLLAVAFYYRRKYKREKNNSIYSNITDISSDMAKNEFGNPMYDATAKLSSFDNLKKKSECSDLNNYEELHWKKSEKQ